MVATDELATMKTILNDNWSNTLTDSSGIGVPRPIIDPIFLHKRLNLMGQDYVLLYLHPSSQEFYDLGRNFAYRRFPLTIDSRTVVSRERLIALREEVRRLVNLFRKSPGGGYDILYYKTDNDLSDKSIGLWRSVAEVELLKVADFVGTSDFGTTQGVTGI